MAREESKEKMQRELEEMFPEIKSLRETSQASVDREYLSNSTRSKNSQEWDFSKGATHIYEDEFSDVNQYTPRAEITPDQIETMNFDVGRSLRQPSSTRGILLLSHQLLNAHEALQMSRSLTTTMKMKQKKNLKA